MNETATNGVRWNNKFNENPKAWNLNSSKKQKDAKTKTKKTKENKK